MGLTVREIQETPNPNARKFVLEGPITEERRSYLSAASAANDELASELFKISGVSSVMVLGDFITISKEKTARWPALTRKVVEILKRAHGPGR